MKFLMIGFSHKNAPIAIRERLSFSPAQAADVLQHWIQVFGQFETVLLSTCNRTELYVASQNGSLPDSLELIRFLCDQKQTTPEEILRAVVSPETDLLIPSDASDIHNISSKLPSETTDSGKNTYSSECKEENQLKPKTLLDYLSVLEDSDVISHLFSVISSIDSMVVGEPQILSQVKNAYQLAADNGTTGPMMHTAFQTALKVAKRISSETQIFQHRVSIPSVAVVDFALQIFERLDDKKTLVLGAGEMAEETLRYLADQGGKQVTVVNRSRERAEDLAVRWNGNVRSWDERLDALQDADLVISTTGAPEPIITLEDFKKIRSKRANRSLFILDLAMPRDIDPNVGKDANVFLYSIDDLKKACQKNQQSRDLEIPKAKKIIVSETELLLRDLRHRQTGTYIRQLHDDWNRVRQTELERLFHKLPDLDEKSKAEIEYAFERLLNKLMHPPLESLRDEAKDGVPGKLLEAFTRLFRLE